MKEIWFHREKTAFNLTNKKLIMKWVAKAFRCEGARHWEINYVFCNDEYLVKINHKYLKHNNLTDIITFDYTENPHNIKGDVFISIDRVRENAEKYKVSFEHELRRVMVHGVLHLLGFKDKTPDEKAVMRQKEEYYLSLLSDF